jgi:hypothetical protein
MPRSQTTSVGMLVSLIAEVTIAAFLITLQVLPSWEV